MQDERMYELLRSMLAFYKEESASKSKQIEKLLAELASVRENHSQEVSALNDTIRELQEQIKALDSKMASLQMALDTLRVTVTHQNAMLEGKDKQILNLQNEVLNLRGHRFGRTTEQQALLNNRKPADDAEARKEAYDGTADSVKDKDGDNGDQPTAGAASATSGPQKRSRRKETDKRAPKQGCHVDETKVIEVDEYYKLPPGAYFMKDKDGNIDYICYTVIEHIKARNVRYIYKVARVHMPDGSFVYTKDMPNKNLGCIFSPSLLAMVLCWKYAYHLPVNRVKRLLRDQGISISKSTLNRYVQNGMKLIRDFMEKPFKREVQSTHYMMVDETTELVGVQDGDKVSYKKKYLWAFFATMKRMVFYLYDKGSHARRVALDFLEKFSGYVSTDGYTAYSIFDDAKKYPNIVHIGCWVHARRKWIDALPTDRRAMDMINDIAELFKNEISFKLLKLKPFEIEDRRERRSKPILKRIHDRAVLMKSNLMLMANDKMRNAVDYLLNQWKSLENFIKSGLVEISNNLCEQRMKPIKLNLKNCQNVGSEDAAENAAFMFSVTESCRLNNINPVNYLEMIFTKIRDGETATQALLPCYYKEKC